MASISASSFKPRTSALRPCSFGGRLFAGSGAILLASHFEQFAEAAFVVFKNHVALDEVLEFSRFPGHGYRIAASRRCFEGSGAGFPYFSLYSTRKWRKNKGISLVRSRRGGM